MPRVILITGASGLVGSTLVDFFLNQGKHVLAITHRESSLNHLLQKHKDQNNRLHGLSLDLLSPNSIRHVIKFSQKNNLEIEHLINNARNVANLVVDKQGIVQEDNFLAEFHLGVVKPYELTMMLAQENETKLRSVVNIASIYGMVVPNQAIYANPNLESPLHYGVVKAALIHMSKELAVRLAPQSIRVNSVSYGGIVGRASNEFMAKYAKLSPQQRMLNLNEIAEPVNFLLANDSSSAVTGHNLAVDGGWTLW